MWHSSWAPFDTARRLTLGRPVDQTLACQGDHLGGDGRQLVDQDDTFDLGKQTLDQAKVATRDSRDCVDHGRIDVLVEGCVETELYPLMLNDALKLLPAQRLEVMNEADT